MSSSIPSGDDRSQAGGSPRPGAVSSDELLPPVEPPTAGFIIQLFVVPAVIVAAVVLVWFAIESLARRGEQDPDQIVAALRSNNQARFQRAKELADMLRLPQRYPELKTNHELAQKLAGYVDELVEAGDAAEASVTMRIILVAALGEFNVDDGLPVLLKAAQSDSERDVRRRAVNAIAVLVNSMANLKPPQPIENDQLNDAMVKLSEDQDELIRSETAFAMGVAAASTSDSRLTAALEQLADDPYTDARFNAAIGLARVGNAKAVAGIVEMLDPASIASSVAGEKPMTPQVTDAALQSQKAYKRNTIVTSALTAIGRLLENKNLPAESFEPLQKALERFLDEAPKMTEPAPVPAELLEAVNRTLDNVKARTGAK
jgi:hypothetical protein